MFIRLAFAVVVLNCLVAEGYAEVVLPDPGVDQIPAALTNRLAGDEKPGLKPGPLKLQLELSDGTMVIGAPSFESLSFKSAFAEMKLALKLVEAIELQPGTARVLFVNGDKLEGTISEEELTVETLFGKQAIPLKHVVSIGVSSGDTMSVPRNGLRVWLSADQGVTRAGNGRVSAWKDRSSSHFDVLQSKEGCQPSVVDGANGRPAIRFDGNDDLLEEKDAIDLLDRANNETTPAAFTAIVVVNPGATQRTYADILDYEHENDVNFVLQQAGSSINEFASGPYGTQKLKPGVFQIYTEMHDQQHGRCSLNGGSVKAGTNPQWTVVTPRHFTVGCKSLGAGERYFNGDIAEVLVYNRVLTDKECMEIEKMLGRKYGISVERNAKDSGVNTGR